MPTRGRSRAEGARPAVSPPRAKRAGERDRRKKGQVCARMKGDDICGGRVIPTPVILDGGDFYKIGCIYT